MKQSLVLALALASCATTSAERLNRSELTSLRLDAGTQSVPLYVENTAVGTMEIGSGGAFIAETGRGRMPVFHVRLMVRNTEVTAIRVPLDTLALAVGSHRSRPVAIYADRDPQATSVAVPGGEIRVVDVVFELASESDVTDTRSLVVSWGVDLSGAVVRTSTVFSRSAEKGGAVAARFTPSATL
jgi:hypothetical protein